MWRRAALACAALHAVLAASRDRGRRAVARRSQRAGDVPTMPTLHPGGAMQTQPDLPHVIHAIVQHTPHWVWAVLAAITVLGLLQLRTQRVSLARLLIAPIALGGYSLWGAANGSGMAAVPAWLIGWLLALLVPRTWGPARAAVRGADGRFILPGSVAPLALMWTVFSLRYVVAVGFALDPALAHQPLVGLGAAALSGALSGLFAARSLRVLQSAGWPAALQAA